MNLKFTPRVSEGELCYRKASFLWNSDNLGEVRIEFFSEIEIQYRVTRSCHFKTNRQTNREFYSLAKIRDSETPWYKKRDCETHIAAKRNETARLVKFD